MLFFRHKNHGVNVHRLIFTFRYAVFLFLLLLLGFNLVICGGCMKNGVIKVARVSTVAFMITTQLKTQLEQLAMSGVDVTAVSSTDESAGDLADNDSFDFYPINIERKIDIRKDIVSLIALIGFFEEMISILYILLRQRQVCCVLSQAYFRKVLYGYILSQGNRG